MEAEDADHRPRQAWVALALSLLAMGVGHVYAGRVVKGLFLYFAWLVLPVLGLVLAALEPATAELVALFVLPMFALVGAYLYSALDAAWAARSARAAERKPEIQRPALYVLLVAVGLIYPVGVLLGFRSLVLEAYVVPTGSMAPTIMRGDRLLANKLRPRYRFPERGELVILRHREGGREQSYIKRVVGLPGDVVALQDGAVMLNGDPLGHEPAPLESLPAADDDVRGQLSWELNGRARYRVLRDSGCPGAAPRDMAPTTVPPHHVFVLGDNRDASRDSRQLGCVHVADITGIAEYLVLPAGSWSRFGRLP